FAVFAPMIQRQMATSADGTLKSPAAVTKDFYVPESPAELDGRWIIQPDSIVGGKLLAYFRESAKEYEMACIPARLRKEMQEAIAPAQQSPALPAAVEVVFDEDFLSEPPY
ncbi:MAG TPA: hypothetical protein V6D27_00720, partial [Vampirovibrionales bacterium]